MNNPNTAHSIPEPMSADTWPHVQPPHEPMMGGISHQRIADEMVAQELKNIRQTLQEIAKILNTMKDYQTTV